MVASGGNEGIPLDLLEQLRSGGEASGGESHAVLRESALDPSALRVLDTDHAAKVSEKTLHAGVQGEGDFSGINQGF